MKIQIMSVGLMKEQPLITLYDRYSTKIPFYMPFESVVIPDIKGSGKMSMDLQKSREGAAILAKVTPGDFLVLLDERGKEMTSREFSQFISKKAATLGKNLIFCIGGPYGFSEDVYRRADAMMSLSKMTFTHEMARVLTAEQIYRALTILKGEPYHHD